MKQYQLSNTISNAARFVLIISSIAFASSCDDNDPVKEDTPELITKATLTFTPVTGSPVVVTATDPDGEGVQDITVDSPINLDKDKSYKLDITLVNGLADPASAAYDITSEVKEEADEHLFFFGWTDGVFATPSGDGNIDNRADAVSYDDQDDNGLPIGLETTWTTSSSAKTGKFHVMLKHQPDLKSATSSVSDGESDLDVEFDINVQ